MEGRKENKLKVEDVPTKAQIIASEEEMIKKFKMILSQTTVKRQPMSPVNINSIDENINGSGINLIK